MKWNDRNWHIVEVFGQRERREALQQRRKRDTHLHAGQRGAKAVVHTVAEREMPRRAAPDVELLS